MIVEIGKYLAAVLQESHDTAYICLNFTWKQSRFRSLHMQMILIQKENRMACLAHWFKADSNS